MRILFTKNLPVHFDIKKILIFLASTIYKKWYKKYKYNKDGLIDNNNIIYENQCPSCYGVGYMIGEQTGCYYCNGTGKLKNNK